MAKWSNMKDVDWPKKAEMVLGVLNDNKMWRYVLGSNQWIVEPGEYDRKKWLDSMNSKLLVDRLIKDQDEKHLQGSHRNGRMSLDVRTSSDRQHLVWHPTAKHTLVFHGRRSLRFLRRNTVTQPFLIGRFSFSFLFIKDGRSDQG